MADADSSKEKREVVYRHSGAVRVTHWVNVVALLVLLMSGLQIFNAHPALYLGSKSNFDDPVMAMRPMKHGEQVVGVTTIAGWNIDTTGIFGLAYTEDGDYQIRGFPWSVTLPGHRDLATGRRWHFFFAWLFVINGIAYLIYSLVSGHLRRDLAPGTSELKHIGASIWEHIRLKFPQGEEAKRYNVLQKLAYLIVALVLLPLMLADRPRHVARNGRRLPVSPRHVRRTAIGAHHPFHRCERHRAVRGRSSRHGPDHRCVEQPPLHDHRPLCDQGAGGPVMSAKAKLDRRGFLTRGLAIAGAALVGGCDSELSEQPWVKRILDKAETLTRVTQRALIPANALAREYSEADISKDFKANGSTGVDDDAYRALAANGFADWKLKVGGLVETPLELTLAELRAMPARTQITRHDCVEGWSCIGKWTGVPLKALLDKAGLKPSARYIVFYCADDLAETGDDDGKYYESVGLEDAFHPQTILAYEMNGAALPVPHGAPLRLRVERQLGYKMAKYVMGIEAVEDVAGIRGGRGGFWEDRGYEWYAGI